MPYRQLTQETYDALLRAYRLQGNKPVHAAAARAAGIDPATAKKGYERGWDRFHMRAISVVLAEEMVGRRATRATALVGAARKRADKLLADARAAAEQAVAHLMVQAEAEVQRKLDQAEGASQHVLDQAERAAERRVSAAEQEAQDKVAKVYDRMRLDAAEQTAEEVMLSKSARKNTLQAHGFMALAWANARAIATQIKAAVDGEKLTPKQLMVLMREMTTANKNVVQASKAALELERLRVGDPTEHVKVTVEASTLDEAEASVEQAAGLLALARRRRSAGSQVKVEDDGGEPVH